MFSVLYTCPSSTFYRYIALFYANCLARPQRTAPSAGAASCPAANRSGQNVFFFSNVFWRKSLAAAAPWTSMALLVPQERRSAQPFARPAQRQRHHPLALLWIAAQRTFQSSAERFRLSALTQMAPGHRESIRARHTVTLRISWSSLGFWSAATRKKGEKEAHDGSVNVRWPLDALTDPISKKRG